MSRLVAAIAATLVLVAASFTAYTILSRGGNWTSSKNQGLIVVVSFPNLIDDIRQIVCSDDTVYSLAPPGVDPHSYQLTLRDYELLRRASIVVSTGHAPFETALAEKASSDKLIVIPDILREHGGRILVNPDTGKLNLHIPIYNPYNYRIFIGYLGERLAELRPSCAEVYRSNVAKVLERLNNITTVAPQLNVTAVGSTPSIQYAVEWLGIHVVKLLVREHGVGTSTEDLAEVKRLFEAGKAKLAVVMVLENGKPATPADEKLAELAEEYGIPILRVPAPYMAGSVLDKLEAVVAEARNLKG
ncbi:metal ABC transporter substrate-binding protein [Hyperthermus butylicus]|uniref:ABC-type metal ion transport system, periplasmic component n=1 Tax=Hyperthermus butylicus (strain DSM 5456 / JCM 9403 / PLM1-5) TaxID=415426 RepID=A2BJS5_HYPBU|nr:zinc ABC transporter substrate-binding protein [Hyperthermus butylicus]ABM80236.1 ABC-type metal ion transport system, periplasmic component [Hyperthermus butylicus DSM 5456]